MPGIASSKHDSLGPGKIELKLPRSEIGCKGKEYSGELTQKNTDVNGLSHGHCVIHVKGQTATQERQHEQVWDERQIARRSSEPDTYNPTGKIGRGEEREKAVQRQEIRAKKSSVRHEPYRQNDPHKVVLTPIMRTQGQTEDYSLLDRQRNRPYVLGYTGYIPGLNFRFGKSFRRSADDSVMEFTRRVEEEDRRREKERGHRARSAPKMPSIRSRDEVKKTLDHYQDRNKHKVYSDCHISPEFPPIAGYTGHIPRLRVTDASLSQRYNTAARHGLQLLQSEREKRRQMDGACAAVTSVLHHSDKRYAVPAV
uniref:Sperm-associated microtubule inner protein 5 domain-containing protein n=1 Tax=Timema tahoe TaxID=61484 RepID=A0A7R9IRT0_9NEOP|nr:unnamed protein product [Timema tahoe]